MCLRVCLSAIAAVSVAFPTFAKLSPEDIKRLPPPATRSVDFARDIKPIFDASCVKCHGRGKSKGGFQLDSRETFLKDADSGPVVVLGNSAESYLVHVVSGLDPDIVMPEKGSRLTSEQVGLLRAWIDQGLKWDSAVNFAREPHRNLKPRRPEVPPPSGDFTEAVDRFIHAYFQKRNKEVPAAVEDHIFMRRVYLDVVGLLPPPAELEAFLKDERPDKRQRLVDELLADSSRYAQHWLSFWNDLLRNDYRGTGYIDGGREPITEWLYSALKDNSPYDQFTKELVDPGEKGPVGFTKGIVWRGAVNASQRPPIQAAQNISQVFLGVNLKCASCHDSFIDDWQLADAYGMAGIYAEEKLELVRCDKPLGQHAQVKFLFPELGSMEDDAPRAQRIARLAELMTSRDNGRLSRTIVNRLWARFLGHGLVEPLDVMQNPAWEPDLLDWLAEDLVEHKFDLKRTMRLILTSRAYQLPVVDLPEGSQEAYVFDGPAVRRMSAEQFRDALGQLTGVWYERPEGGLDSLLFEKGNPKPLPVTPFWIWSDPHAAEAAAPQTIRARKTLELKEVPTDAVAFVNADNSLRMWVNGQSARRKNSTPWDQTSVVNLRPFLKAGVNTIAVEVVNEGDQPNPAGLLFYARLRISTARDNAPEGAAPEERILDFATDATWLVSTNDAEDWQKPGFDASGWASAQVLGPAGMAPWNIGQAFAASVAGEAVYGKVRASLVSSDPLMMALGRPNREQVTTARPYTATTIQMLELTNGETLARVLKDGAEKLASQSKSDVAVVNEIFQRGLGRKPTPDEATLSTALLGRELKTDGIEDLLWSVAMLPEFQLIY